MRGVGRITGAIFQLPFRGRAADSPEELDDAGSRAASTSDSFGPGASRSALTLQGPTGRFATVIKGADLPLADGAALYKPAGSSPRSRGR
jgi:hypothetical protein